MQEEYVENSIMLAGKIQEKFKNIERKSRGIGQEPFMVLHKAYMPRVLIETGFISNETEGAYLNSEEGQDEMAEAIATAIIEYKKEYIEVPFLILSNNCHHKLLPDFVHLYPL